MVPLGLYNMLGMPDSTESDYQAFYRRAVWQLKFVWWPRRCNLSQRWIWLCWAYQGTAIWTGPGDPVYEFRYHTPTEHLIWQLKQ